MCNSCLGCNTNCNWRNCCVFRGCRCNRCCNRYCCNTCVSNGANNNTNCGCNTCVSNGTANNTNCGCNTCVNTVNCGCNTCTNTCTGVAGAVVGCGCNVNRCCRCGCILNANGCCGCCQNNCCQNNPWGVCPANQTFQGGCNAGFRSGFQDANDNTSCGCDASPVWENTTTCSTCENSTATA